MLFLCCFDAVLCCFDAVLMLFCAVFWSNQDQNEYEVEEIVDKKTNKSGAVFYHVVSKNGEFYLKTSNCVLKPRSCALKNVEFCSGGRVTAMIRTRLEHAFDFVAEFSLAGLLLSDCSVSAVGAAEEYREHI